MLQNSLIYNPTGADTPLGKTTARLWPAWISTSRMVVPRSLCTYHRIPCEGVPFFKLQEFARLQALQHSPFVHYGSSAVKQGSHLHLWIWDQKHEDRFAQKLGQPKRFQTIAHSLLARPHAQGLLWIAHPAGPSHGCEVQLWENRQLQDSQWFDTPPTPQAWQQRHAQYPELATHGWPQQLTPIRFSPGSERPFGINLTPRAQNRQPIHWAPIVNTVLVLVAAGVIGWAAWLQGQILGYQNQIAANQAYQEQKIEQDQPQQIARAATHNTLRRIESIKSLNANTQTRASLEEINQLFSRQGLWVRDIDINGPTIDATLIAPPGVTPRLTAILGVIENSELFYDARFNDVVPGGGFRFSWRIQTPSPGGASKEPATDTPNRKSKAAP
jgi:hypothetical protein